MLREAAPQIGSELGHLDLGHGERRRKRLAGQVVGRAPETARDDHHVHQLPLAVHELRHGRDLVRNGRGDRDPHAQGLEPLGEPGRVRVDDVAGDDLVPDREESRTHEPSMRDPPDPAHRHGTPRSITDPRSKLARCHPGDPARPLPP